MLQNQKWTDEQRDALGRAVVEDGLTSREVRDRALAGTLAASLEPFGPVPVSTIRDCGTRWRRRRKGEERSAAARLEPAAALRDLFERVVSILERELEHEVRAQRRADVERVGRIGKTLRDLIPVARELDAAQRSAKRAPTPDTAGDGGRQHRRSTPATLADALLEEERSRTRGGQATDGYTDTHIGGADHARAVDDDGSTARVEAPPPPADTPPGHETSPDSLSAVDSGETEEGRAAAARLRERIGMPA